MSVGSPETVGQQDIINLICVRAMSSPHDEQNKLRGLFLGSAMVGVLIGLGSGYVVSPGLSPRNLIGAAPAELRLDIKDDYIRMIAAAYSLDGDMPRALDRLSALRIDALGSVLTLAQREPDPANAHALIALASDMENLAVSRARPTFTPRPSRYSSLGKSTESTTLTPPLSPIGVAAETPTFSPVIAQDTPKPNSLDGSLNPSTTVPHFDLVSKSPLNCLQTGENPVIQIWVQDSHGNPLPGVGVMVETENETQLLYTGLKPEYGVGYASLSVTPGIYNIRLSETASSNGVFNLTVDEAPIDCTTRSNQVRGWRVMFRRSSD